MKNLQELIESIEERNYEVYDQEEVTESNAKEEGKSVIAQVSEGNQH